MKRIIDFFLDAGFLLAIGAVCLCYESYLLLGKEVKTYGVLVLIFFSTLFIYSYRFIGAENTGAILKSFLKLFVLGIIMGMMISCTFVHPSILMLLIPFGLLSMIYNLPIVHCTNNIVRLREIPYLKIFLITITWAFVTVMIPARDLGIDIFSRDIGIMFLRRVLFIFALAIPFDIRDAREDKMCNLKTLPVKLGEKKSKFFALIALLIYCIINVIYYFDFKFIPKIGLAFFLCALVAGVFIFISTPFRNKYFFQVGLDGMMILQFILVWGALKL